MQGLTEEIQETKKEEGLVKSQIEYMDMSSDDSEESGISNSRIKDKNIPDVSAFSTRCIRDGASTSIGTGDRIELSIQSGIMAHQNQGSFQGPGTDETLSGIPREDQISCEKCGQHILVWDYPEHLDYHVALDLQKQERAEARQAAAAAAAGRPGTSESGTRQAPTIKIGKKRGRPPGSKTINKKTKQGPETSQSSGSSTLHSFFKSK